MIVFGFKSFIRCSFPCMAASGCFSTASAISARDFSAPGAEIRRILFVIYYITSISSSIFQGLSTSTPLSADPEEVSCHWSPKNKMQVFLKGRCPRKNLHLLHKLFFSFQSHCRRGCCLSPLSGIFHLPCCLAMICLAAAMTAIRPCSKVRPPCMKTL